jgi:hypothetical protein
MQDPLDVVVSPQLTQRVQGRHATRLRIGIQESHNRVMRRSESMTSRRLAGRTNDEVLGVREEAADERPETMTLWMHSNGFDGRSPYVRIRRSSTVGERRKCGLTGRMCQRHKGRPSLGR